MLVSQARGRGGLASRTSGTQIGYGVSRARRNGHIRQEGLGAGFFLLKEEYQRIDNTNYLISGVFR